MTLIQHHYFFDPPLFKIIEAIQGGTSAVLPDNISLNIKWPDDFQAKLQAFLKKGDLTSLPEILSVFPMAMTHPCIFWEIQHLAKMVRLKDTQGITEPIRFGWTPDESETILSSSDKDTAKALLEAALSAWVPRLLPGYVVMKTPQAKKLGRKPKWNGCDEWQFFFDFTNHCDYLIQIFHKHSQNFPGRKKNFWKPQAGESQKKFYMRMRGLLRELWENEFRQLAHVLPPTPEEASAMIKYAIRSKSTVDPRWLLYAFLAHGHEITRNTIRGVIERYEADHPDEAFDLKASLYGPPH